MTRFFIIFIILVLIIHVYVVSSQNTGNGLNNSAHVNLSNNGANSVTNASESNDNSSSSKSTKSLAFNSSTITRDEKTISNDSGSINQAVSNNDNNQNKNGISPNTNNNEDPTTTVSDNLPISTPVNQFQEFLNSINFKFVKPNDNEIIYSDTYVNVQWECNYINENIIRNISVVLHTLDETNKGVVIRNYINLNDKGGNYPLGKLNNAVKNYNLWLFTTDYGRQEFFEGPFLVNGNCTANGPLLQNENGNKNNRENPFKTKYIIWIVIFVIVIFAIFYCIGILIIHQRRKNEKIGREYKEYKGYTNFSPSMNEKLGINDINNKKEQEQEQEQIDKENKENQSSYLNNSVNTTTQSINALAEQLYKAEQVYNNKVFKNPNIDNSNEYCAPLVDMSSLYKSTQAILTKSNGKYKDYMPIDNNIPSNKLNYDRKLSNKILMENNNKKEEESFLVLDENDYNVINSKNKYNNNFGRSDSVNSNKILAQSTSFSITNDSEGDQALVNHKPFNILEDTNTGIKANPEKEVKEENEDNDTDEDYISKNSFCLNSKDSIDMFENIYLNKQNEYSDDSMIKNHASPLVAAVMTVEEYLATHRNSGSTLRLSRSSSLINSSLSESNSFIPGSTLNVIPKLSHKRSSLATMSTISAQSSNGNPSKILNNTGTGELPLRPDSMNRVSSSDFNSSSMYMDSSINSSILEELNSIEKQIQQQRQKMLRTQQLNSIPLQSNLHQNIDPNQLNLQMANLHQQGIDPAQYFASLPSSKLENNKYNVPYSTETFQSSTLHQASPPIQPKTLSMNSPSYQTSAGHKATLPGPLSTPSFGGQSPGQTPIQSQAQYQAQAQAQAQIQRKTSTPSQSTASTLYTKSPTNRMPKTYVKNGVEVLGEMNGGLQKSQESEATLQAQQATQDTVSVDENDDEVETIVATHVCNAWYSPHMPDELRMCPGDELIILERFNDGWGFGQNTKGDFGVFPLDCVTFIDYNDSSLSINNGRSSPTAYSTSKNPSIISYGNNNGNGNIKSSSTSLYPINDSNGKTLNQTIIPDINDIYGNNERDNDEMINYNDFYNYSNSTSTYKVSHQNQKGYLQESLYSPLKNKNNKSYSTKTNNNYNSQNSNGFRYY